jgi:hypothetical protein
VVVLVYIPTNSVRGFPKKDFSINGSRVVDYPYREKMKLDVYFLSYTIFNSR